ncbi:S-adenosyl-L-methionine-dependent methyltransferase [Macrolepiota fuliginosa MF-IS2]|uniref:S-adenosyl-L-methionine-dependent methyltransferase n=1 Tax=Macrolepiota fuliginosa MF-IS2 TaxID=1400762 RepID=A0A9P5X112_9AGAR|nr:S-adenosyl-L-methionine-dependent methyltransferase [Macrolepiota fuliginosa MF-IS2]
MLIVSPSQDQSQVKLPASEPRRYTRAPGTAYLLPSDEEERQRLTKQNALINRTFGELVHAPITLTSHDFVLESAAGTGAWLLELAEQTPEAAKFIGIDIESHLFPNPATLPPNISFEVQSVLNLPDEWTGKYTLVHQRLLIAAFRTAEWPQAFKQIFRVLRPGGWLQLEENDNWVAGPVMENFRSMMLKLGESRNIDLWPDVTPVLKGYLEDCGFVDVRVDRRCSPLGSWGGQDGRDGKDNLLSLFRGIRAPVMGGGGFGVVDSEEMYDDLMNRVELEMDSEPGALCWWVMICARKPEFRKSSPSRDGS